MLRFSASLNGILRGPTTRGAPFASLVTGSASRDDIVIYEVMAPRLDRRWWKRQRAALERAFRQQQILIRASAITVL